MKTYQNPVYFPEPDLHGKDFISGDPFVYRFNGRYYLYPTASPAGIVAWESEDLVEWKSLGIVLDDPVMANSYAPEIFYFNGSFYLFASPMGDGHYIYTSKSPTGPFERLTDHVIASIDGSMFADDDGTLYFLTAAGAGIWAHKIHPDGTVYETVKLEDASMECWTEGPGIIKRKNRYYLTISGNHLRSRGYRIDYVTSDCGPFGPWQTPSNKTILVNTDYENGSLGHSSTVIGPDLDSYWMYYYSNPIDRNRIRMKKNFRMDRLLFPGDEMAVSGPSQGVCPAPLRADFYGWADQEADRDRFVRLDGMLLSADQAEKTGTAEVNLITGQDGSALFAYRNDREYISVRCAEGQFRAVRHTGEAEQLLLEHGLYDGFRTDVLHSVRVEFDNAQTHFYVDMMKQGSIPALDGAGRIGSKNADLTSYMAFHNQVGQSSDRLHYHNIPGTLYALLAMPDSDGEIFSSADGQKHWCMRAGDQMKMRLNVEKAGRYHVQALIKPLEDARIEGIFQKSGFETGAGRTETLCRAELGIVDLEAGIQECVFEVKAGEILLHSIDLFPVAEADAGTYTGLDLWYKAEQLEGDVVVGSEEGLIMNCSANALSKFGDRSHTDGFIEADILFYELDPKRPAGLFMRVSEDSVYPGQVPIGHRGYFLGLDGKEIFIWRMNFDKKEIWRQPCPILRWQDYCIRMEIKGRSISVWLDQKKLATVTEDDPLPYGRAAVGSFGERIRSKRVQFELI